MMKTKKIFDLVILGIALGFAVIVGNSAMAVAGVIIVMLSDRIEGQDV